VKIINQKGTSTLTSSLQRTTIFLAHLGTKTVFSKDAGTAKII